MEDKIEILKLFSKEALIKELASRKNVVITEHVMFTEIDVYKTELDIHRSVLDGR